MTTDEAMATAESEGWCVRNLINQALKPDSRNWFTTLDGGEYYTNDGLYRRRVKAGIGQTPAEAILMALSADEKTDEVQSYTTDGPHPSLYDLIRRTPINRRF